MTPEEKAVIAVALDWRHAVLAHPHGSATCLAAPVIDALTALGTATYALSVACPQCNTDRHLCPGCGESVSHVDVVCADCEMPAPLDLTNEYVWTGDATADSFPCHECLTDPTEDPLPWCDCRPNEPASETHVLRGGPCRFRAHPPESCPNAPTSMHVTSAGAAPVETCECDPLKPVYCQWENCHGGRDYVPPPKGTWLQEESAADTPETGWEQTTLLYCLAGDRIRIGTEETDVLRSGSGVWYVNTADYWHPTPWKHTELRLDLKANPGYQEYPPNLPCEIWMTSGRRAVYTLQQAFPGTTEVKRR